MIAAATAVLWREIADLRRRTRTQAEVDADRLHAIAAAYGARDFTAAEIITKAAVVDSALRSEIGDMDARRLGKWLERINGADIAGLRVDRIGAQHGVAVWRVVGVE